MFRIATNQCKTIRFYSQSPVNDRCNVTSKSYELIPGPKGLFGLGTFYHYFPVIGQFDILSK